MFTVWFEAAGKRPDFARFLMQHQAVAAVRNLRNKLYPAPLALTVRVRSGGDTVFSLNRPAGGSTTCQAVAPWPEMDVPGGA